MLWHGQSEPPIDYRDILRHYETAKQCEELAGEWLRVRMVEAAQKRREEDKYIKQVELQKQLGGLSFGEHVAENEEESLGDYFVETQPYRLALQGDRSLFVGKKGTGKTANLLRISEELKQDKRNLVCVVMPVAYELEAVVALLKEYKARDIKGYVVESLWKFLIYTEIANACLKEATAKPAGILQGTPEFRLRELMSDRGLIDDFAVRLEKTVGALLSLDQAGSQQANRAAISEKLHGSVLAELRSVLGDVLEERQRVAVLVDNLDKPWSGHSDLEVLSDFLFGLLRVTTDMKRDFSKSDNWRRPVNLTVTVFVRSDIFDYVKSLEPEPDKLTYSMITWDDPELLIRVVESRFAARRTSDGAPRGLWNDLFCAQVKGMDTKDYLLSKTLPRPRDLVYLCNAAVSKAVNRAHTRVEEGDILAAETEYSQFALEAAKVESGVSLPRVEEILYEFVGNEAVVTETEVRELVDSLGIDARAEDVIDHLCAVSFLGVEKRPGVFAFVTESSEMKKVRTLGERFASRTGGEVRFRVHPAFHAYLEIRPE